MISSPECIVTGYSNEEKLMCVYRCVSPECNEEIYGKDAVRNLLYFLSPYQKIYFYFDYTSVNFYLVPRSRKVKLIKTAAVSFPPAFGASTRRSRTRSSASSVRNASQESETPMPPADAAAESVTSPPCYVSLPNGATTCYATN